MHSTNLPISVAHSANVKSISSMYLATPPQAPSSVERIAESIRIARQARAASANAQAGALFNGVLDPSSNGGSSNSSGYGSQMGMIMEESSETGGSLLNLMEDGDGASEMNDSTTNLVMNEEHHEDIQGCIDCI